MEKTVLYSKKSLPNTINIKDFQCCAHEHCKQLLSHIRYLTNESTEKLIKEDFQSSKSLKGKQNKPSLKLIKNQTSNCIEDQIQVIKKNYNKLKKQLGHLEEQNDELFEENQILKKKLLKVEQSLKIQWLQLSMTKCNQISPLTSKNSFYLNSPVFQVDYRNQQDSRILPKSTSRQSQLQQLQQKYSQLKSQYSKLQSQQSKSINQMNKLSQVNRKAQQEISELKRIIRVRNQLQIRRNRVVGGLTNILDELGV